MFHCPLRGGGETLLQEHHNRSVYLLARFNISLRKHSRFVIFVMTESSSKVSVKRGSNWQALKAKLGVSGKSANHLSTDRKGLATNSKRESETSVDPLSQHIKPNIKARYVGLDCEMVGTGPTGKQSVLARCCLVDFDGNIIYDHFVRPQEFVTGSSSLIIVVYVLLVFIVN